MNTDELISALEYNHGTFPRAALVKAVEEKEMVAPRLLQVIEHAAADIQEIDADADYMLHIYALYLLAQFRETDAYLPIIRLVSMPGDVVKNVTGDVVSQDLGRILASTFNGDVEPLKRLIEDKKVNEYVRCAAIQALFILWGYEKLSRQEIVKYYKYIISEVLVGEDSFLLTSSVTNSLNISPNELEEEIHQAFDEGLIDEFFVNRDDFTKSLGLSNEEALVQFRKRGRHRLIENTISEMQNWACFPAEKKRSLARSNSHRAEKKVGRNDPCPCGSGKKYKKCCHSND